ncbi:MAG: hypothetical protein HDR01_12785 [Lachnospiraceae bacterium]|nr:hypothetical protein [Lachnospiraceae bacterium]
MEKEKKVEKLILGMFLGSLWCVAGYILYLVFNMGMLLCYVHPYEIMVIQAYFMFMFLYSFHKRTNGIWVFYLECGFLPVFILIEGYLVYMLLMDIGDNRLKNLVYFVHRYMPLYLIMVLLASFIYKRRKKLKIDIRIIKINKSIFVSMLGFFCYFSTAIIGSLIFSFELMMVILLPLVMVYIVIAEGVLKREYRWMLFFSNIVISFAVLLNASFFNVIGSYGADIDDLKKLIIPVLPYSIAVAIGELIVWLSDKRKDSRLAKQEAEDIESDWYL